MLLPHGSIVGSLMRWNLLSFGLIPALLAAQVLAGPAALRAPSTPGKACRRRRCQCRSNICPRCVQADREPSRLARHQSAFHRPADQCGKPVLAQCRLAGRRAGHRPVHPRHREAAQPGKPVRPGCALTASIDYLAELKARFGNLGLAAVAYNAGEGAASRFIAGGGIPLETENYVISITGRPAEEWREAAARHAIPLIDAEAVRRCLPEPRPQAGAHPAGTMSAARQPWGVQVAENFSRSTAVRIYNRLSRNFPGELPEKPPMLVPVRNRASAHGFATRPHRRSQPKRPAKSAARCGPAPWPAWCAGQIIVWHE